MTFSTKLAGSAAVVVAATTLVGATGAFSAQAAPRPDVIIGGSMQFDQPDGGPIGLTYTLRLSDWYGGEGKESFTLKHSTNLTNPTVVSHSTHISLNPANWNTPTSEGIQEQMPLDGSLRDDTLVVHYDVVSLGSPEAITAEADSLNVASPNVASTDQAPLAILSGAPTAPVAGKDYSFSVVASRFSPLTYTATGLEGTGLQIDSSTGHIGGIATTAGSFPFTVAVHDAAGGADATAGYTLRVAGTAPQFSGSATLADAAVGQKYSFHVTATGTPAPQFTIAAGRLPNGLSLNKTTGIIAGTPTSAGEYTFRVAVANSAGSTSRDYSISVTSTSGDM